MKQHFLTIEEGDTSIEYALRSSLIAAVIVLAVSALGISMQGLFQSVVDKWPK